MKKELTRRQFLQRTALTAGALATANSTLLSRQSSRRRTLLRRRTTASASASSASACKAPACSPTPSNSPASNASPQPISTTAATRWPAKSPTNPISPSPAATRNSSTTKTSTASIAAVPDSWHRKVVVDAVSAGKDIYCEKPMSHDAADGVAMVKAGKNSGRIIQIGSQRVSSVICAKAKELIAQGTIGDLMLVEGSMGRNDPNGAWEYPPPFDLSPQNLDWDAWQERAAPKRPWIPTCRPNISPAGAAGRNTAPGWPATCSFTWSVAQFSCSA